MKKKIEMTIDEYRQFHKDLVSCLHDFKVHPMPTRRSIVVYMTDEGRYGTTALTFNDDYMDWDRVEEAGGIVVAEFDRVYEDEIDFVVDSWERAERITGFSADELCSVVSNWTWEDYRNKTSCAVKLESEISLGDVIDYIRADDDLAVRCHKAWIEIARSDEMKRDYMYQAHKIADKFVAKHLEMLAYLLIHDEWEQLDYDAAVDEYCRICDTTHNISIDELKGGNEND